MSKICMGGICGMGMAPLAAFLADDGESVVGFDDTPNLDIAHMLETRAIVLKNKDALTDSFDELVISTALAPRKDSLGINAREVLSRGEKWARVCASRKLVAIIGSHGKSSVSAMLAHATREMKEDCGWLIGAIPHDMPMHNYCAKNKILISEIDESDGTIENFSPEITVALNYDLDHTNTYADASKLSEMFERIFSRTRQTVIYPKRDTILAECAKKFAKHSIAVDLPSNFIESNKAMTAAAYKVAFGKELPPDILQNFKGLFRRQEVILDTPKLFVMADYAHHPSEVQTFLEWFAQMRSGKKIAIFQPHRYTRTRQFAEQFARILSKSANEGMRILLLPVYAASESPDPRGECNAILKFAPNLEFISIERANEIIKEEFAKDENLSLAIVGAGDYYFKAKKLISQL